MAYTKAQKAKAIETYMALGASAAALEAGCSRAVVYVWLAELDTDVKKGPEARIATAERLALKRAAMVELFHDKALELAAAVDPDDPATSRFMLAACQAADKAFLMAGLLKKSTDPARLTMAELEAWISELEGELAKVAPADSKAADVDRELARMRDELERKIRGEILEEIDKGLGEKVHPERAAQVTEIISSRTPASNGKPVEVIEAPPDRPRKDRHHRPPPEVGPSW